MFLLRLLHRRDLEPGELIYRLFMGFYGLVFPAYAWLCILPGRGRVSTTRRQWLVWAATLLIVAPMFWMAFIEREMVWVVPGVAVVLLARLLVGRVDMPPAADALGDREVDAGAHH
jgi:hypothetical protein